MPTKDKLVEFFQPAWNSITANYQQWLVALVGTFAVFFVLRLVNSLFRRYSARMAKREKGDWFHDLEAMFLRTKSWILLILSGCCGYLMVDEVYILIVRYVAVTALLVQAALWANVVIATSIKRISERRKETDAAGATTLAALGFVGRMVVWCAAALMIIANLGVNITAMVAGMGIGGIAIALAAQNILGDLFASASIVLDKPFVLGDFIVVDDKSGNVEYIGLKTTRLRSISGEQIIFSNADLLKCRIHNYKRMYQRRIVFTLGVTYDTALEKMSAIPDMVREAIEAREQVRFDRAHFASFGDSALNFEVVYYVLSSEFAVYRDIQQEINLAILRRFTDEKIEFAFPSRTIYQG